MSKGSKPRPYNKSTFNDNFDRIFGNDRTSGTLPESDPRYTDQSRLTDGAGDQEHDGLSEQIIEVG
jgi:hypothetical protein